MNPIDLSAFQSYGSKSKAEYNYVENNVVVMYTRVSGKEQFDKNLSLETQTQAIEQHAEINGKIILARFGGTYESAKTDGRKEFQRMLDFIRNHKGQISQILVYLIDRFSRTGGSAIALTDDLRVNYGVSVLSVAQPIDTRDESGILSQNMQLLFSNYENRLRRKRAITGLRAKFEKGIWITKPPMGYDIVYVNPQDQAQCRRQKRRAHPCHQRRRKTDPQSL